MAPLSLELWRNSPGGDAQGRRRPWPRVPDQLTLVHAIRGAVDGKITRAQAAAGWARQGPSTGRSWSRDVRVLLWYGALTIHQRDL